jgi:hypothetical protein
MRMWCETRRYASIEANLCNRHRQNTCAGEMRFVRPLARGARLVHTCPSSPYCPFIRPTAAVDFRHRFRAAAAHILLMVVAGWVHRQQLIVIEYLQAENRLLKERLRGKRIRFTDAERALLAGKAKAVGRRALLKLDSIVSPETLMRWHRRLVAQK